MGETEAETLPKIHWEVLGAIAGIKFLLHAVTAHRYGYFRDELYYIACARELAWGYVDHPPLSLAVLKVFTFLFGEGLFAIRLPAMLVGAAVVLMTGLIAREMGGGRFAQAMACLCALVAPVMLGVGNFFSMNGLDHLFWCMAILLLVKIINTGNSRLWLLFGVVTGLGLLNKISVLFLGVSMVVAMLLTPHRKYLLNWQLWAGGAIALLIFLPHLIWQMRNAWPTLEFTANAALYKNAPQGVFQFLLSQFLLTNPITVPLWVAGLFYGLFGNRVPPGTPTSHALEAAAGEEGNAGMASASAASDPPRYRWLVLIFAGVFLLLSLSYGKAYYLAPAFPILFALGACWLEKQSTGWRGRARNLYLATVVVLGALLCPLAIPLLPVHVFLKYQSVLGLKPPPQDVREQGELPQHFADRFGWEEFTEFVAAAYLALPEEDRVQACVLVSNYGEAGALNLFGPALGLPPAISGHNNYYLWGPGDCSGEVMLVYHHDPQTLQLFFKEVTEVGRFTHPFVMPYQNNVPLYLCRGPRGSLEEAWPALKHFI